MSREITPWADEDYLEMLDLIERRGVSIRLTGRTLGRSTGSIAGAYSQIKKAIAEHDPDGFRDGSMPERWWVRP